MPLYEYKCAGCGQVFEVLQRFSDDPLTTHEACGGHVERLFSAPAFQFKGSGFYITDYARGSASNSPAKADGGTSKNGDSSKDSKPSSSPSSSGSTSSSSSSATSDTKK